MVKTRDSVTQGRSQTFIQFDADLAFGNDFDDNACNDLRRFDGITNIIAVDDGNITTAQKVERNRRNSFKNKTLTDYLANLETNLPVRQLLG
jgi:hypothetical protein